MPYDDIAKVITPSICDSQETFTRYTQRVEEGKFTRDENPQSHYCVYFLPYNPKTHEVFIVHHKKSGLWISPGGHIDKNETLFETLNREIHEELGMVDFFAQAQKPFLLTITLIENPALPCKAHYDIWFLVRTDGKDFQVDAKEFHETTWASFAEARRLVTDPPNLKALDVVERGVE
jgi:8-oxo-dGTP pyrophosphatase MutT (NUDIX family)